MAAVYEAHDSRLDRAIALKILPPEFLHDDSFAARFEREARLVARLDHPAIVPIFASGIDEGIPWMSMRLAAGGSLAALLRNGRLPQPAVISILEQVAGAIDHAHARGVTHRDIKPANILLDGDGHACVADFGLAHLLERNPALTSTGVLTGTPHYMAPEQALGKATGQACDIYSLGIVAYEMIVGHLPFEADSPIALLMKQVNDPLPEPDDRTIPSALLGVVRKATSKDPANRWASAAAFITALASALDDPDTLRIAEPAATRTRQIRRSLLAATLSCALLASFIWYQAQQGRSTQENPPTIIDAVEPAVSRATRQAETADVPPRTTVTSPPPRRLIRQSPPPLPAESVSTNRDLPPAEVADRRVTPAEPVNPTTSTEPTTPSADATPSSVTVESTATALRADGLTAPGLFTPPTRLRTVAPNYPSVAQAGQIQGDVVLQAAIDQEGRVTDVTVARRVHPLLDEAARQAVLQYEYAPGRRDGIAVSSTVRIVVSFRLR
jgi:TonB family protein